MQETQQSSTAPAVRKRDDIAEWVERASALAESLCTFEAGARKRIEYFIETGHTSLEKDSGPSLTEIAQAATGLAETLQARVKEGDALLAGMRRDIERRASETREDGDETAEENVETSESPNVETENDEEWKLLSAEGEELPDPPKGTHYAHNDAEFNAWCPERWDKAVMVYPPGSVHLLGRIGDDLTAEQWTVAVQQLAAGHVVGFSVAEADSPDLACDLACRCTFPIVAVFDGECGDQVYFARRDGAADNSEN